jgi:hypothetical protein
MRFPCWKFPKFLILTKKLLFSKIDEQQRSMVRSKSEKNIVGKYPRYNEVNEDEPCEL